MKKAFKILTGGVFIWKLILFNIGVTVGLAAVGIVLWLPIPEGVARFLSYYMATLCAICVPAFCVGMLMSVYNCNFTVNGGRYFRSLPNSAKIFRGAILFGNIISLCSVAVTFGVLTLEVGVTQGLSLLIIAFLGLGVMNFFGHSKSVISRIVVLMVIGMCAGFYTSFLEGNRDPDTGIMSIIAAAFLAVYIVSLVVSLGRAAVVWNKEDDK